MLIGLDGNRCRNEPTADCRAAYSEAMIRSFADKEAENIWDGLRSRKLPPDIQKRALDKLLMIHAAEVLEDLRSPPSNRLHALRDDRAGQHSVSIH